MLVRGRVRLCLATFCPMWLSPIIVSATLGVAAAILTESALSFLGLGFPPDVPTWGTLVVEGQGYLEIQPWLSVIPGVLISLTVLSINFMGDGLRDALDPRDAEVVKTAKGMI